MDLNGIMNQELSVPLLQLHNHIKWDYVETSKKMQCSQLDSRWGGSDFRLGRTWGWAWAWNLLLSQLLSLVLAACSYSSASFTQKPFLTWNSLNSYFQKENLYFRVSSLNPVIKGNVSKNTHSVSCWQPLLEPHPTLLRESPRVRCHRLQVCPCSWELNSPPNCFSAQE